MQLHAAISNGLRAISPLCRNVHRHGPELRLLSAITAAGSRRRQYYFLLDSFKAGRLGTGRSFHNPPRFSSTSPDNPSVWEEYGETKPVPTEPGRLEPFPNNRRSFIFASQLSRCHVRACNSKLCLFNTLCISLKHPFQRASS
jgi:hypothetical protein